MKTTTIIFCMFFISFANAQSIFGKWKTMDDETGTEKAIVNIYEKNGKVFGKVVRVLKESERNKRCTACEGERKGQKIEGMTIIENLEKTGEQYKNGTVLDPENGKVYKAKVWLNKDNPNILNVRGYIGLLYRTQNWVRLEEK